MKTTILWYGFLIASFVHCHSLKSGNEHRSIEGVEFRFKMEYLNLESMRNETTADTIRLYFSGDSAIFIKYPITQVGFALEKVGSEIVMSDRTGVRTEHYQYFRYRRGESLGQIYDEQNQLIKAMVLVDSLLRQKLPIPLTVIDPKVDRLIKISKSKNQVVELYDALNKPDNSYADTVELKFQKDWVSVPFSLSHPLDSSRNSKLTSIRFVYNPYFEPDIQKQIPSREFSFEFSILQSRDTATNHLFK